MERVAASLKSKIMSAEEAAQLVKAAKRKRFLDIPGNGILLTVPLKSVAGGKTLAYLTNDCKTGGTPHMEFNHELIVVILNEGYADLVMDVRFLPNPYYDPELRPLTGLDAPVRDFVRMREETIEFEQKWHDLLDVVMPGYVAEGKQQLAIGGGAVGPTGLTKEALPRPRATT